METTLKPGGNKNSATASTASPNPKPATSNAPRMLTPSEKEWLRQDKVRAFHLLKSRRKAAGEKSEE
jgi:hypothetical protein